MPFIKVIIHKQRPSLTRGKMRYPQVYDANEIEAVREGPIVYNGGIGDGAQTEEAVIKVDQATHDKYVAQGGGDVVSVTAAEVDAWLLTNPKVQKRPDILVEDEARLEWIRMKLRRNLALNAEDQAALDPDNDTVQGFKRFPKTRAKIFLNEV